MGYTLVGLLARGGTAVVELATDDYGRQVARKRLLLTGTWQDVAVARQRLAREAEVLRRLDHPNIVPLWTVEEDGDDLILVMPYLRGGSLANRMGSGRSLSTNEVVRIGRDLLDALSTAHRQGVVHRDIKPGNILFDEWGRPALCDFGIAWTRETGSSLTQAGAVLGTPAFMAPEQARGEGATPASDVFSLAATLAYALTGQTPYGEGSPDVLLTRAARGRVAPLPPSIPAHLRLPLAAMLRVNPAKRPSAAEALGGPQGTSVFPGLRSRLGRSRPTRKTRPVRPPRAMWHLRRTGDAARGRRPAWLPALLATGLAGLLVTGVATLPRLFSQPAVTDHANATPLIDGQPIVASLVAAGEVDRYPMPVQDHLAIFPFCSAEIDVTLTAPSGVSDQVRVLHQSTVVAQAVSADGVPAVAALPKPGCFSGHSGTYQVEVSSVAGLSAADYRLVRSGSW